MKNNDRNIYNDVLKWGFGVIVSLSVYTYMSETNTLKEAIKNNAARIERLEGKVFFGER